MCSIIFSFFLTAIIKIKLYAYLLYYVYMYIIIFNRWIKELIYRGISYCNNHSLKRHLNLVHPKTN